MQEQQPAGFAGHVVRKNADYSASLQFVPELPEVLMLRH
jgi:hypothetical protein